VNGLNKRERVLDKIKMTNNQGNKWDKHFEAGKEELGESGYNYFQTRCRLYIAILNYHEGLHNNELPILDTGAGSGILTRRLARNNRVVTAIDNSCEAVKILKKECKRYSNIHVFNIDVQDLDNSKNIYLQNETYGGVSSMLVLPFPSNNLRYFNGVHRVLRKSGLFTITAWAPGAADVEKVTLLWEKDLTQRGILPKDEKRWRKTLEGNNDEAFGKIIRKRNLTKDKLETHLKKTGFKNIEFQENNPYEKYWFSCVCRK
jgi:SAM-dependent methyltransferase